MIMKYTVQDADVVAGTLAINSVDFKVLMDYGATGSIISESVVDRLKCVAYPLESNLIIKVANQERVVVNRVCPNCDIVIEGRNFFADLIPFKLGEFDIILGMDWLVNHDAQIECRSKKVKLKTKDGTEDVEKESLKIEDTHVVKEFPDVFPDELPRVPPDREIEFTIDFAPGTEPVSKAPYQMANVVADALSRMKRLNVLTSSEELIKKFEKLEIYIQIPEMADEVMYVAIFQPEILEKIRRCQEEVMVHKKDKLTREEVRAQKDDKGIY
ncbi:uncharacterized protein LOC141685976 [Apium graveolens]|uniref:uncharacterized protein LOC141685976 n=1 Tax=Apium graveolens TaxID=4045 RepID=UPI003D7A7099